MWNGTKQHELDLLLRREAEGTLTGEESSSLENLLRELEQEEWVRLRPAFERLHAEHLELRKRCGRLRSQNAVLAVLVERQESILTRSRANLAELLSEHEVLKDEYEHITGQPLGPPS